MDDVRFGAALRAARVRRGWRQVDVARAANISGSTVSRLERGNLDALQVQTIRAIARVLEVTVEMLPRSRSASLERIASQAHATLAEQALRWLSTFDGWTVRPEVSFSHFGERGVIDLLGWHASTGSVLVVELKTEIVDVGELLGTLDRKLRNATVVARVADWQARNGGGLLLIGESDVNRRRIRQHEATFEAALPQRVPEIRRWLASPQPSMRGLMFFANRHPRHANDRITAIRRVRRAG